MLLAAVAHHSIHMHTLHSFILSVHMTITVVCYAVFFVWLISLCMVALIECLRWFIMVYARVTHYSLDLRLLTLYLHVRAHIHPSVLLRLLSITLYMCFCYLYMYIFVTLLGEGVLICY